MNITTLVDILTIVLVIAWCALIAMLAAKIGRRLEAGK